MRRPWSLALAPLLPHFAMAQPTPVTPDNFIRAESDLYFAQTVQQGGVGQFHFAREPALIAHQPVVRANRDTLYGSAVFDLDAGPVTITLPDAGGRFRSLQVFGEDHYTHQVIYEPGSFTFTREDIGKRYMLLGLRILVDPNDPADLGAVHALQDATKVAQPGGPGAFEVPDWDKASQDRIRAALLELAANLPDTWNAFGPPGGVDPVRHLIETAAAWGGNPERDALYLNVEPERNDGKTIYRLQVADVPVDGFWSVSVYNAQGYYEANPQNAYSLNNLTAKAGSDGTMAIQFGGCDGTVPNCLPTVAGWNYMVRLYRPRATVLDGTWSFPKPVPVE